jgi:hypothetical protein
MEERGFDVLLTGNWPLILVCSTVLLTAIIILGGLFMRNKEMQWRATHREEEDARADAVNENRPRHA